MKLNYPEKADFNNYVDINRFVYLKNWKRILKEEDIPKEKIKVKNFLKNNKKLNKNNKEFMNTFLAGIEESYKEGAKVEYWGSFNYHK